MLDWTKVIPLVPKFLELFARVRCDVSVRFGQDEQGYPSLTFDIVNIAKTPFSIDRIERVVTAAEGPPYDYPIGVTTIWDPRQDISGDAIGHGARRIIEIKDPRTYWCAHHFRIFLKPRWEVTLFAPEELQCARKWARALFTRFEETLPKSLRATFHLYPYPEISIVDRKGVGVEISAMSPLIFSRAPLLATSGQAEDVIEPKMAVLMAVPETLWFDKAIKDSIQITWTSDVVPYARKGDLPPRAKESESRE